RKLLHDQLIL
ncbi:hypothetical protein PAGU2196_54950, partial [Pseudomonas sp. PAGU 2196]